MEKVIIDFRGGPRGAHIDVASFYTAITRVTNGNNLYLRSFKKSFIRNNPAVEFEINRMRQLKPVKYRKVYLREQIYVDNTELRLGFLNIRGLCESFHAQYFDGDRNLQNLDMICLAETHLQSATSNMTLEEVLSNWQIQSRFDSPDGRKHMGLLILTSKSTTNAQLVENLSYDKNGQTQMQVTTVCLAGILFCFVYTRTSPTHAEAEWLYEKTRCSTYLLGDLNLRPDIPSQKRLIDVISGNKTMILRCSTTSQRNQLDHILGPESDVRAFTTTYLNFISDHFAITLRIPLLGADFIDDDRLKKQSDQRECLFQEPAPPTPKRIKKPLPGTPTKKKKGTRRE